MTVDILTQPETEPVLLDELKSQLRIDGNEENPALAGFIVSARTMLENHAGLALVSRSLELTLDKFSEEGQPLPVRPITSIEGIQVIAVDGSSVSWDSSNYYLTSGIRPLLNLQSGRQWPVPGRAKSGIKIQVTAGFGDSWNSVPADLQQAVLMLATYLYTHRGDEAAGNAVVASGAASLLRPYREHWL